MQQSSTASGNSNKRPCKGILKTSSSFDKHSGSHRKSAKFDELNVLQTYHPPNKDYGHMKIEEPKTPYNYSDPLDPDAAQQFDAELLAEKLNVAAATPAYENDESSDDEQKIETDDEKVRRIEFEKRRKAHYNEFEAVRLARKLIEEEDDDEDEDNNKIFSAAPKSPTTVVESTSMGVKEIKITSDKNTELAEHDERV